MKFYLVEEFPKTIFEGFEAIDREEIDRTDIISVAIDESFYDNPDDLKLEVGDSVGRITRDLGMDGQIIEILTMLR